MSKPSRKDIAQAMLDLTSKTSATKAVKSLAQYLVQERRTSELDAIMREVEALRREQTGVEEFQLTSAFTLKDSVKKELTALLGGGKKTVVNEVIDKDVLGGVRVESSEAMLDLTVRNRLQKLKQGVV